MSWASRRSHRDCAFASRSQDSLSAGLAKRWPSLLGQLSIGQPGECSMSRSIAFVPAAVAEVSRRCRPRRESRRESHCRANSTGEFQVRRGHVNPTRQRGFSSSTTRLCGVLEADTCVREGPLSQRADSRIAAVECLDFRENDPLGRRQVFEPPRNSDWNLHLRVIRTIRSLDREFRGFEWILVERTQFSWAMPAFPWFARSASADSS